MKKLVIAALLGVAAIGGGTAVGTLTSPVAAARPVAPLELTGRVVDDAHLLDLAQAAALEARLKKLEALSGPQLVVVTTPSLNGQDISQYGLALGNGWGVGTKDRNDGVLLIVAPNEKKVRIEVGRGLEKVLPDDLCAKFIRDDIIPHFRHNDFAGGIAAGVDRISAVLTAHPTLPGAKA